MRGFILGLFLTLSLCGSVAAQGCGNNNPNCIVPTAPPGTSNNQAASTAFVQNQSAAFAPSNPIVHPSSGNLVCSIGHFLWWIDQNLCTTADVFNWVSSDPSAIFQATIGGTITANDTVSLIFTFGGGACSSGNSGCKLTYTVLNTDTTTTIAAALVALVKANATLFTSPNGGYASGAQIAFVNNTASAIAADWNSNVAMKVTSSVTGAGTETVTISTASCGTSCVAALDNNPVIEMGRNPGAAPVAGSVISGRQISSTTSASPAVIAATYAGENVYVDNSTTGSLAGHWCWYTTTTAGANVCREYVGLGVYTTNTADKGADSFNALSYWLNGTWEFLLASGNVDLADGSIHFHFNTDGSLDLTNASTTSIGLKLGGNLVMAQDGTFTYLINPAGAAFFQSQSGHNFYNANTHTFQNTAGNQTAETITNGIQIGTPTGGDKGLGTLNVATGYYLNNVLENFPASGNILGTTDAQSSSNKTITASTVDNSIIGGTTPAAGTFTVATTTHELSTGSAPTCASTGTGSTGTCTLATGSNDFSGTVILTAGGTGIAATGALTLTLNASLGAHDAGCIAQAASGTGAWTAPISFTWTTLSQTAPIVTWTNASTALTTGQTYKVRYQCVGY